MALRDTCCPSCGVALPEHTGDYCLTMWALWLLHTAGEGMTDPPADVNGLAQAAVEYGVKILAVQPADDQPWVATVGLVAPDSVHGFYKMSQFTDTEYRVAILRSVVYGLLAHQERTSSLSREGDVHG